MKKIMKFTTEPTQQEINDLRESGEIIYQYESESGLGNYKAILTLPKQETQDYIFKQMGTDKFISAIESTKDEVVLWCNPLTNKSLMGMIGAYTDFFQKASPSNLTQLRDS
jgi:hypothetical protein